MTWARLDDGFYSHPKVLDAMQIDPASIGLHTRAISYAAGQEIDGKLPERVVEMLMPTKPERDRAVGALVEVGLWHKNGKGYVIHDYLDYNPSREELTAKRRSDRERKQKAKV